MTKMFVIMGSTGEYSDRNDWVVCIVPTSEMAKAYVDECTKIAKVIEIKRSRRFPPLRGEMHPLDPHFRMDYTGTFYWAEETEVVTEVPNSKYAEVIEYFNNTDGLDI